MIRKLASVFLTLLLAIVPAYAAGPTALSIQVLKVNNYAVGAGDLTITFSACDAVNGNFFVPSGYEILLVQNTDGAAAHTFTVNSVPDPYGRIDTSLTSYSVAASASSSIQLKYLSGWQSGGKITLACSDPHIQFAVLRFS